VPAATVPIAGAEGAFDPGAPTPGAAADDGELAPDDGLSGGLSGRTTTCGGAASARVGDSGLEASVGFGAGRLVEAGVAAGAGASFNCGCAGALGASWISRAGAPLA
jgi:hypothetical protein